MHLATHLMLGWVVANIRPLEKRDRGLVTWGGIIPDADASGFFIILLIGDKDWAFRWHTQYHHVLTHNLLSALLIFIIVFLAARQRILTAVLAFFSFHLHLLGDLVGSRGPDGYQWPINYLFPFSDAYQLTWNGQWQLNAWPNIFITIILLLGTIYLAWERGYSPVEFISSAADRNFIATLRKRFGQPHSIRKVEGREGE